MKTGWIVALSFLLLFGAVANAQYQTPAPSPRPPAAGPSPAQGGQAKVDVKAEVKTAATHAGFAANGGNMGYVRLHLGHALNCLEGPRGKNFTASWGNVCQGQGSGIIPDLNRTATGASLLGLARQADEQALKGVKAQSLTEAKGAAQRVKDLLTQIGAKLK